MNANTNVNGGGSALTVGVPVAGIEEGVGDKGGGTAGGGGQGVVGFGAGGGAGGVSVRFGHASGSFGEQELAVVGMQMMR